MPYWRNAFSSRSESEDVAVGSSAWEISDGSIKYVAEAGGNVSGETYQEASGAPVEKASPMGYSVNSFTILFLNISMMIGTGIFSTRKCCRERLWPGTFFVITIVSLTPFK